MADRSPRFAYPHAEAQARHIASSARPDELAHALDTAFREGRTAAFNAVRRAVGADRRAADAARTMGERARLNARANLLAEALLSIERELQLTDPSVMAETNTEASP